MKWKKNCTSAFIIHILWYFMCCTFYISRGKCYNIKFIFDVMIITSPLHKNSNSHIISALTSDFFLLFSFDVRHVLHFNLNNLGSKFIKILNESISKKEVDKFQHHRFIQIVHWLFITFFLNKNNSFHVILEYANQYYLD